MHCIALHCTCHRHNSYYYYFVSTRQDITKQFSGAAGLVSRSGKDIYNARWAIFLGGFLGAAVISGLFIAFMSVMAWIIVWATLICCWIFIFVATIFSFDQAGNLDALLATAADSSGLVRQRSCF
eukprot:SAG22_NODE_1331_length_4702_cov_2.662177_4_plen_125_part_00